MPFQLPFPRNPKDIRTPPFLPNGLGLQKFPEEELEIPSGTNSAPMPRQAPFMDEEASPMELPPPGAMQAQNAQNSFPSEFPSDLPEAPQLPGKLQAKPHLFNPAQDLPPLDVDKLAPIPEMPQEQLPQGLQELRDSVDLYKHVRQGRPQMKPPGALNRIAAGAMGGLGAAMQLDRNPGMQAVGRQVMEGSGKFLRPGYDRDMANWNQEMKLAGEGIGLSEKLNKAELESGKAKASGDYMKAQSELMRQKPELERNKGKLTVTPQMVETFPDYWDASEIGSQTTERIYQQAMKNSGFAAMNESKETIADKNNTTRVTIADKNQDIARDKIKSAEQIAKAHDDTARWVATQRKGSGGRSGTSRDRLSIKSVFNKETGEDELVIFNLDTKEQHHTKLKPSQKEDLISKLAREEKERTEGKPGAAKASAAVKANSPEGIPVGTRRRKKGSEVIETWDGKVWK